MIARFRVFARQQAFVLVVGTIAGLAVLTGRVEPSEIPSVVDERVLLVLFALLVSVELIRAAGLLDRGVARVVVRFHRPRTLVLALALLTGALSSVVTNDVALFIVIPMTMIAGTMARFSVSDAVVLEVIAANLLGSLTPLGNPQNLYVHHLTGWSPVRFAGVMLPFVLVSLAGLIVAVVLTQPAGRLSIEEPAHTSVEPMRGLIGCAILSLVLGEMTHVVSAWIPAAIAVVAASIFLRRRLADMGLSIIPLFFFAFIIVAAIGSFGLYDVVDRAGQGGLFVMIVGASQVISNVPATVLFAPLVDQDWRLLLYAVNAGGCGTIIASLANLLGWRIWVREGGESGSFLRRLLMLSVIFLIWTSLASWILLRLR